MELKELKEKKDKYITGIFWLCLQIALIFGIPAGLGAYFGIKLDNRFETGRNITIGILFGTFILSWVITIFRYKSLSKKIAEIDKQIKEHPDNKK